MMCIGEFSHIDPAVIDCVLPAAGRDYSTYQFGRATPGQVCALHYDP